MPRINALPPQNSPDGADLFAADDVSDGNTTKKVTFTKFKEWLIAQTLWITNAMLAAGIIDSSKIDWNSATGKIWWEELGRTTLGSAGDSVTVSSLANRKHIRILFSSSYTGVIDARITFNGDTGTNYAYRVSRNGAADGTATSGNNLAAISSAVSERIFMVADILNVSNREKQVQITCTAEGAGGAGAAPNRNEMIGKWANTATVISSITVANAGAGDYSAGAELIVLGHD